MGSWWAREASSSPGASAPKWTAYTSEKLLDFSARGVFVSDEVVCDACHLCVEQPRE